MDIQILLVLQALRQSIGGCLNSFFAFITTIAVDYYIMLPGMILFWAVNKRAGLIGLGSYGAACYGVSTLKSTFCVYRPWVRSSLIEPLPEVMSGATGYSFPSGHSASVSGMYGGLIAAYRKHKGLCTFLGVMIALTMFSRLYVGVHTPQDVLAGLLVGAVGTALVLLAERFVQRYPKLDWVVVVAVTVLCAMLLPYIYFKEYPMDYVDGKLLVDPIKMTVGGFKDPGRLFGVVLGWFVERRWIRFDTNGTPIQKVMRCLVGALLFVFYWTVIMEPIGKAVGIGIVHFFLQASCPFLFMTVYPLLFRRIESRTKTGDAAETMKK